MTEKTLGDEIRDENEHQKWLIENGKLYDAAIERAQRAEDALESEQENHRAIVNTMNRVAAERDELQREIEQWRAQESPLQKIIGELTAERDAARAEVWRLRAALEPFARAADAVPDRRHDQLGIWTSQAFVDGKQIEVALTIADLRNARAALDAKEQPK